MQKLDRISGSTSECKAICMYSGRARGFRGNTFSPGTNCTCLPKLKERENKEKGKKYIPPRRNRNCQLLELTTTKKEEDIVI